ncbi:hypothetical protein ASE92_18070 [Pedobacter sp. Leaf41]|nr:hypothetical protein ASE92_18070 [Pedobacter sp. Leaf41]
MLKPCLLEREATIFAQLLKAFNPLNVKTLSSGEGGYNICPTTAFILPHPRPLLEERELWGAIAYTKKPSAKTHSTYPNTPLRTGTFASGAIFLT